MPQDSFFVSHYRDLHDEELLEHWRKQLVPEARAALQQELDRRGLRTPERSIEGLDDPRPAEPVPTVRNSRTIWWQWLKFYGAVAPLVVLNTFKVSTGAIWLLFLAIAGYALAVVWIIQTQTADEPWGKGTTVTLFVVVHFFVMFSLVAVIRALGSMGQS